ncbi:MAG: hypothetical protein C0601_13205 [Candidatus Muiribacterium halophilum]|uniref:EF-hand domain-containing protein n=1 Tax=Muiribacterium halophilum TaxID=2053465 RepID=A0A2N5Z9H8_MUIH1|nr:MAG: hypothetical protein C0601_13205 [Candidatus Muirbacterium halophilum]
MKRLLIIALTLGMIFSVFAARGNFQNQGSKDHPRNSISFKDMDSNGDGQITEDEFKKFNKNRTKNNFRDNERRRPKPPKALIEKFDTDGNGELSKEEAKELGTYMKEKAKEMKEKIDSMFDKDQNGKIDENEREALKEYFKTQKEEFEAKYDIDKDGRISPEEMDNVAFEDISKMGPMLMRNQKGPQGQRPPRPPKALIEKFDTDGDGKLSKEEAKELGTYMKEKAKEMKEKIDSMFDKDQNGKIDGNEREALKEYFKTQKEKLEAKYDIDNDGKISPEEMDNVSFEDTAIMGPILMKNRRTGRTNDRNSNDMKKMMLKKLDTDGDGKISKTEKEKAKNFMKKIKNKFIEKYDLNKDGKLSNDEKSKIPEKIRNKINKVQKGFSGKERQGKSITGAKDPIIQEYYLKRYDDNDNGKIDREEKDLLIDELKTLKKRYDIDGDGNISKEESKKMYDTLKNMAKEYLRITE